MMTSYLSIQLSGKTIFDYNMANLLHLVRLALRALRLQIQDLFYAIPREDVVAPSNSLLKAKCFQDALHSCEWNICVSVSAEDLIENFFDTWHGAASLTQFRSAKFRKPAERRAYLLAIRERRWRSGAARAW